jgi:hypothetical protein
LPDERLDRRVVERCVAPVSPSVVAAVDLVRCRRADRHVDQDDAARVVGRVVQHGGPHVQRRVDPHRRHLADPLWNARDRNRGEALGQASGGVLLDAEDDGAAVDRQGGHVPGGFLAARRRLRVRVAFEVEVQPFPHPSIGDVLASRGEAARGPPWTRCGHGHRWCAHRLAVGKLIR